jgi:hypothetical protein
MQTSHEQENEYVHNLFVLSSISFYFFSFSSCIRHTVVLPGLPECDLAEFAAPDQDVMPRLYHV